MYFIQTKCSAPKSIQLSPPHSLVSPLAPLSSLIDQSEAPSVPINISLNNSTLADGEITLIKEQLPPQHPVRQLLVDPSEVRKKLSDRQLDDLLTMIGSKDYIR